MFGPLLLSKHWIRRLDCGKTWKSAQENRSIPFRSTVSYHLKFYESTYYKDFYSTIGNLPRGTPCAFRFQNFGQVYGFVQKPTINHKMIEVYIPVMDLCTYITRDQVMPLRSTPREIRALPRYPQDNNHRFQRSSCGGAVVSFFISNRFLLSARNSSIVQPVKRKLWFHEFFHQKKLFTLSEGRKSPVAKSKNCSLRRPELVGKIQLQRTAANLSSTGFGWLRWSGLLARRKILRRRRWGGGRRWSLQRFWGGSGGSGATSPISTTPSASKLGSPISYTHVSGLRSKLSLVLPSICGFTLRKSLASHDLNSAICATLQGCSSQLANCGVQSTCNHTYCCSDSTFNSSDSLLAAIFAQSFFASFERWRSTSSFHLPFTYTNDTTTASSSVRMRLSLNVRTR